jgi:hypothetical protein
MPPKAPQLPPYMRDKRLKSGKISYYFEPPGWAKKPAADDPRGPCPVEPEALGTDFAAAKNRVEQILLPAFESWRTGGRSDLVPLKTAVGTFDWMAGRFKETRAWDEIGDKTRRAYDQGLELVAKHALKDGTTVGARLIAEMDEAFTDALFQKLLLTTREVTDEAGNVQTVTVERRRFAIAAMTACRRAWFAARRAEPKIVPKDNPFSKMGLKGRAPGEAKRSTPTATWAHLVAFRAKAKELGESALATAALLTWEWSQREEHLFGAFEVEHYRPKDRPNMVLVVHPKNGEEVWWPLFTEAEPGETPEPLFPELMAELDAIKAGMIKGLMIRRNRIDRKRGVPVPWMTERGGLDYMRGRVKEIIRAAELPDDLSFTSFRHGGLTEAGEAELTDAQIRAGSRHKSSRMLPTYVKSTRKQLIDGALKRRATRTKTAHLSE